MLHLFGRDRERPSGQRRCGIRTDLNGGALATKREGGYEEARRSMHTAGFRLRLATRLRGGAVMFLMLDPVRWFPAALPAIDKKRAIAGRWVARQWALLPCPRRRRFSTTNVASSASAGTAMSNPKKMSATGSLPGPIGGDRIRRGKAALWLMPPC
jgi:hypothetical protein